MKIKRKLQQIIVYTVLSLFSVAVLSALLDRNKFIKNK